MDVLHLEEVSSVGFAEALHDGSGDIHGSMLGRLASITGQQTRGTPDSSSISGSAILEERGGPFNACPFCGSDELACATAAKLRIAPESRGNEVAERGGGGAIEIESDSPSSGPGVEEADHEMALAVPEKTVCALPCR